MGSAASQSTTTFFPTTLIDCTAEVVSEKTRDARYEYACTSDPRIRWPMTISHLLITVALFLAAFIVYMVYLRLVDRRLAAKLKATPSRLLPVGRDVASRKAQLEIFEGFASAAQDYSPAALLAGGAAGVGGGVDGSGGSGGGGVNAGLEGLLAALLADKRL
jgi:hypothetical protein